jgi:ankyrin repeat protein
LRPGNGHMAARESELVEAMGRGDPSEVAALIAAGADVRYVREHGYTALIDAVHNRDVARDPRLIDLLRLLIGNGVDLNGITTYRESGLRVLSHIGRFDAVRVLLEAGADRQQLGWTPLIEAVALGSLDDVDRLTRGASDLEEADWWSRTAWLVALIGGDLPKARLLRERGANVDARGRCGQPPLFYAIEGHHPDLVRWLLDIGQDVDQTDEFGSTAVIEAVEAADVACLDILLAAGADVDRGARRGSALGSTGNAELVERLLRAGADPGDLTHAGHRALCGLGEVDASPLAAVSADDFARAYSRRFGTANPERMREPFWDAMIRSGVSAYEAARAFHPGDPHAFSPVWCAQRFGQSITRLPDGRVVQIAGEHEDYYDADFCIYNDVFVHTPGGSITLYGYPEAVFPPTDFHTATLVGDAIYLIGSLGYMGTRRYGQTPVYRLDTRSFRMERLEPAGEAPSWIHEHRADLVSPAEIRISGGTVVTASGGQEAHTPNPARFVLDLARLAWRREV